MSRPTGPDPTKAAVEVVGLFTDLGSVTDRGAELVARLVAVAPSVLAAAVLGVVTVVGMRSVVRRVRHRRLLPGARLITVLAPPEVDPDGAAALWGNLAGLLRPRWRRLLFGQPHLCFEYVLTPDGATIRIWVPGSIPPGLVEHAITAAWPGATTHTTTASAPAGGGGRAVTTGGVLRLARTTSLPISDTVPGDPVAALLAAPGELAHRHGDRVTVTVLVRPRPTRRVTHRHTRSGVLGGLLGVLGDEIAALGREILTLATPGPIAPHAAGHKTRRATTAHLAPRPVEPRARLERSSGDRAAVAKARSGAFETLIRYAATTHLHPAEPATDEDEQASLWWAARARVRGRAHAVAAVFASFTGHNFYRRRRLWRPARAIATRRLGRGDVLSVAELAAIATLPTGGHTPGLVRAGARSVAPPPGIPTPGPQVKPLGDTTTGSSAGTGSGGVRRGRPVGVRVADARHHLHVIGATGSGKSTLLVQMILADIRHHRGVVVIDPKGDLVTDVLDHLPTTVRARATVIDPDQPGPPPSLNPLDPPPGADRALAVENLVSIFSRVFHAYWGPRTDDLMRAASLTLHAQPTPRSLADLPGLLTDPDIRARHMRAVTNPVLRGFWDYYDQLSDPARAQLTAPLMNKVRALLLRPFTHAILTTPTAASPAAAPGKVDMTGVLDGGILLVRIPKGSLGDEGTRLVGSIVLAQVWAATTARAATPQHQRRDAALVMDECHNFLTLPYGIEEMLAEARGLRLSIALAHQHLAQLSTELREGISTNARNKIFFAVGPEDARDLARHTQPHLGEHDLGHLDAFHAAARLVHHDTETPAFTLTTRPLPTPPLRT